MSEGQSPARRPPARRSFIVLLGLLAIPVMLVAAWLLRSDQPPASSGAAEPPATTVVQVPAAPDPVGGQPPAPTPTRPAAALAAGEELGSPDAGAADADIHPHPITPRHIRIQRENNLIGALNGAMDVGDATGLRGLLDQYRSEFPEDPNLLQAGYKIIADCLQYPGAASKAAGQSYFDRERGSILRRFVARHCQLQLP